MVMDYMDHELRKMMTAMKEFFTASEVKRLFLDLLQGIDYMHEHWVIHRDLKPANLLINSRGMLCIADFGLARKYADPLKEYTNLVVTLWYRAPELLLGGKKYGAEIDMWSLGCIFAEIITKEPLLPAPPPPPRLPSPPRLAFAASPPHPSHICKPPPRCRRESRTRSTASSSYSALRARTSGPRRRSFHSSRRAC